MGDGMSKIMGAASPISMGLGLLSSGLGVISALKGAKEMRNLSKTIPQYARSQYANQMLATAQRELNANPFQAAQNRNILGNQANMMGTAQRAVTNPSQLLSMVGAYSGMANDMAYKNSMMDDQRRQQNMQNLYNAQAQNMGEDRNIYDNQMTAFNSKANLLNAANQTTTGAFQNMAGTFMAGSKAMNSMG